MFTYVLGLVVFHIALGALATVVDTSNMYNRINIKAFKKRMEDVGVFNYREYTQYGDIKAGK